MRRGRGAGGQGIDAPEVQPLPLRTGETVRLIPVPAPRDDPSKRYGYSFFTTGGSTSALRSTDTTATGQPAEISVSWTAPPAPETVRIWVVARDGRGGTGWIERSVAVR